LRQEINLQNLFILVIFYNPNDIFDVGGDGWAFMLADFGEAVHSLLLAIVVTYYSNAIWWKIVELIMMVAIHILHVE
jgi:hypothetical protein